MTDLCYNCGNCHFPSPCVQQLGHCKLCGQLGHTFNFCHLGISRLHPEYRYFALCHNCDNWHLPDPCQEDARHCGACGQLGHLPFYCPVMPLRRTNTQQLGHQDQLELSGPSEPKKRKHSDRLASSKQDAHSYAKSQEVHDIKMNTAKKMFELIDNGFPREDILRIIGYGTGGAPNLQTSHTPDLTSQVAPSDERLMQYDGNQWQLNRSTMAGSNDGLNGYGHQPLNTDQYLAQQLQMASGSFEATRSASAMKREREDHGSAVSAYHHHSLPAQEPTPASRLGYSQKIQPEYSTRAMNWKASPQPVASSLNETSSRTSAPPNRRNASDSQSQSSGQNTMPNLTTPVTTKLETSAGNSQTTPHVQIARQSVVSAMNLAGLQSKATGSTTNDPLPTMTAQAALSDVSAKHRIYGDVRDPSSQQQAIHGQQLGTPFQSSPGAQMSMQTSQPPQHPGQGNPSISAPSAVLLSQPAVAGPPKRKRAPRTKKAKPPNGNGAV